MHYHWAGSHMHIRFSKLSLLAACCALQMFVTTSAQATCAPNEILVHTTTDQIDCATDVFAEKNGYLYSDGAVFGRGSSALMIRSTPVATGRPGLVTIDVPGIFDHAKPYTEAIEFNQDTQTIFNIGGSPELTLGLSSAFFNADVYVNPHLDANGDPQNPTNIWVSGGVNASNFSILLPKGGSLPLTAPPVCIGKNVLQFDGQKYLCTPLKNLM